MDTLTTEQRSALMARVRASDTKPEMIVRRMIHALGYRFRLHKRDLPGTPDIVLPRLGKIVLVHGCFWHRHRGCALAREPRSNKKYWAPKLDGNARRDQKNARLLRRDGWRLMTVWECQTRSPAKLEKRLLHFLEK